MRTISELSVSINVNDALEALKSNQKKHEAQCLEAHSAWADTVAGELERLTFRYKKTGRLTASDLNDIQRLRHDEPRSFAKEYERSIAMLRHCADEKIAVPGSLVGAFFEDQWDWTDEFRGQTMKYSASLRH